MVPLRRSCEVRAVSAHCSAISRLHWRASAYNYGVAQSPENTSLGAPKRRRIVYRPVRAMIANAHAYHHADGDGYSHAYSYPHAYRDPYTNQAAGWRYGR